MDMNNLKEQHKTAKDKMINGLIKILQYKDFLDITVKDLCIISKVNRTTFYAYYNNTYELLDDSQSYMIDSFLSSFPEKNDLHAADFLSKKYLIPYLNFIKEKQILYKTYIKNSINITKNDHFQEIIKYVAKPIFMKKNNDETLLIYISRFYIDGITSVVNEWIRWDFKEDSNYIADLIIGIKENKQK